MTPCDLDATASTGRLVAAPLDAVITVDFQGRILEWSSGAAELFGFAEAEAAGASLVELLIPEFLRDGLVSELQRCTRDPATERAVRLELQACQSSGTIIPIEMLLAPASGSGPGRLTLFTRDLRQAAQFGLMLDTISEGFIVFDQEWRFSYLNAAALRLMDGLGHTREELMGQVLWEILPDTRGTVVERDFRRSAKEQAPAEIEFYYPPIDTWFRLRTFPTQSGLTLLIRNITERKRIQEAQQFLDETSELLFSSLDYESRLQELARLVIPFVAEICMVDVIDSGGAIRRIAVAHADPEREGLLREFQARYPPFWGSPSPGPRAIRSGESELLTHFTMEVARDHAINAEHLHLLLQLDIQSHMAVPLIARGQVLGAISLGRTGSTRPYAPEDLALAEEVARRAALAIDNARLYSAAQSEIAERRQAEAVARETEARFKQIAEAITAVFWIASASTGELLYVSPAIEQIWGIEREAIYRDPNAWMDAVHPEDRAAAALLYSESVSSGRSSDIQYRIIRPDGSIRWIRDRSFPVCDELGSLIRIAHLAEDITTQRELEAELRDSEAQFRSLVEQSPLSIQVLAPDGRTLQVNPAWERLWEATLEQLHAVEYNMLEDEQLVELGVMPYIRQAFAGEPTVIPPVRYDRSRLLPPEKAGDVERWVRAHVYPVRDAAGRIDKVVLIHDDYTDRKRLEDALLRHADELAEADRQKDLFLAMLAHELRNPLSSIRTAAELIRRRSSEDPAIERSRLIIERQTGHLTRLVDDLLDVARITGRRIELRKRTLDLAALVSEAVDACRASAEERRCQLELVLPDEPAPVLADPTRAVQVISNLLTNAIKYTQPGGRIEVRLKRLEAPDGAWASVTVQDNGKGIPERLLPHVFDLFTQADRTLDRSEGGLGIGLTIVRSLMEQHGGTVAVRSAGIDQGSEFEVRFPIAEPEVGPAEPAGLTPGRKAPVQPRKILIVEDMSDTAEALRELLELSGHDIRIACDGPGALIMAAAFRPDVVLLDIGLPQMTGYEVARRLRANPDLGRPRLIAVTGYGRAEDRAAALEAGFDHYLVKPIDIEELIPLMQ